jgi:cysteine desulfuration protein SufE
MIIIEREIELIQNLELFPSWEDRYQYIIELGESLPLMNLEYKTEENLIKGCQSKLWLKHEIEEDRIYFLADSESPFPKGLAALYIYLLSGNSPKMIVDTELKFLDKTELRLHLSPLRLRGVNGLYNRMKSIALDNLKNG